MGFNTHYFICIMLYSCIIIYSIIFMKITHSFWCFKFLSFFIVFPQFIVNTIDTKTNQYQTYQDHHYNYYYTAVTATPTITFR
eukprot:UN11139